MGCKGHNTLSSVIMLLRLLQHRTFNVAYHVVHSMQLLQTGGLRCHENKSWKQA